MVTNRERGKADGIANTTKGTYPLSHVTQTVKPSQEVNHSLIIIAVQENKLLEMKIHVPILNKMKICSLEVYN